MSGGGAVLGVLVAGIGDLVLGRDALCALKAGYPDRALHLLVNAQAAPLVESLGLVDRVWAFPIRDFRSGPWALGRVASLVRFLRRERYALAVNLYAVGSRAGALKMGLLLRSIGAGRIAGIADKGLGLFLDKRVSPAGLDAMHVSQAMLRVAVEAGGRLLESCGTVDLALPGGSPFDGELAGEGPLVGINPGADMPGKLWPPERFAAVADALVAEFGARIVVLGGPGEEGVGKAVADAMKVPAVVLTGRMTLLELGHVLSGLDLLVTNDSGPMHLAACAGTPVAALFGQADPRVFGPLLPPERCRVLAAPASCRPCGLRDCDDPRCLLDTGVEDVLAACRALMARDDA